MRVDVRRLLDASPRITAHLRRPVRRHVPRLRLLRQPPVEHLTTKEAVRHADKYYGIKRAHFQMFRQW